MPDQYSMQVPGWLPQADRAPSNALNLCDALGSRSASGCLRDAFAALWNAARARAEVDSFDRIYIGSYFCDRLFLSLNDAFFSEVASFARECGASLTLVLPIFGQGTLERGIGRVEALLAPDRAVPGLPPSASPLFDEVVVNDPAMARRVADLFDAAFPFRPSAPGFSPRPALVRGRLMAKAPRDPRYLDLGLCPQPCPIDARQAQAECAELGFSLMELDPFAPVIDAARLEGALPIALHLPHCAMSTGHICEAASIGVPERRAFRPGSLCRRQCLDGVDVYEAVNYDTGEPVYLTRQGRTTYFENPGCRVVGDRPARVVWSPADFACPYGDGGAGVDGGAPEGAAEEEGRDRWA